MPAQAPTQNPPTARKGRKPSCKHPLPGDKKCGLAQGHTGDHKPRQTVKRDLTTVDVASLCAVQAPPEAINQKTAPARTRSDRQQAVDAVVAAKHKEWVAAEKPTQWLKIPREVKGMYVQAPDRAELVRFMLRSAADFHGLRVKFGTPARVAATLPDGKPNPDAGKEIIVFAVMDKTQKTTTPGT